MPWFYSRHIRSKHSRSLASVIPGVSSSGFVTIFFVLSPMFNFFFLNDRVGVRIHGGFVPQVLSHAFMPLRRFEQDPTLCVSQVRQRAHRMNVASAKAGEPWLTGSSFPNSRLGSLGSSSPVPASPDTLASGRKILLLRPVFSGGGGKDAGIFYGLAMPSRLGSAELGESL